MSSHVLQQLVGELAVRFEGAFERADGREQVGIDCMRGAAEQQMTEHADRVRACELDAVDVAPAHDGGERLHNQRERAHLRLLAPLGRRAQRTAARLDQWQ